MSHVLEQNIVIRDESEYGSSLSNVDNTMIGLSWTAVGQHNNPRDSSQKILTDKDIPGDDGD